MAGHNLVHGSWADAEALIGKTLTVVKGADPVAASDFRRQLEVLGWDGKLHTDAEFARSHGYADVVSPVTMTSIFAIPSYWSPGQPRIGDDELSTPLAMVSVPGEGEELIGVKVRSEYFEPIYPGDRITATAVLKSVTRKVTKVGPGAFLEVETTYRNQRDEVVAVEMATGLRYTRTNPGEAA